jgi:hypothetical protein
MDALTHAQQRYTTAVDAFKRARDEVTEAKRELARLQSRKLVLTDEQREARNRASRRQQVLRSHPELRGLVRNARRHALDAILDARDAPCVWKYYMDAVAGDPPRTTRSNRARFDLYRAGLTVAARMLRLQARHGVDPTQAQEDATNARTLELHLQSLVDVSPHEVSCHYPSEWRVISSALRPEGSDPKGKGARRLYALYQHIVRTHREEAS